MPQIDKSLLASAGSEILVDFYERAFKEIPDDVRQFIEDKLLTVTGARNLFPLDDALTYPEVTPERIGTLIDRRLIRKVPSTSTVWIELTHDIIADVARASKRHRDERRRVAAEQKAAQEKLEKAEADAVKARKEAEQARVAAQRRAQQRTVAWVVACFCLALASLCAWEWWKLHQQKTQIGTLTEQKLELEQEIGGQKAALENLDAQVKNRDAKLSDLDAQVKDRDAKLSGLDMQVKDRDVKLSDLDAQLKRNTDDLNRLNLDKQHLNGQLAHARSNAEDILRMMAAQLNETNEIGALSLQDVRARAQPFLNFDQVKILQTAFLAVNRLPQIMAGGEFEDDADVRRGELLMAESRSTLAVLRGNLGLALAECNSLLERSQDFPKNLDRARAELLKLRGEIFATQGMSKVAEGNLNHTDYIAAKEDCGRAVQDLKKASELVSDDPIFEASLFLSLSDIDRQLSSIAVQGQDIEELRNQASEFAEEAKKRSEDYLANMSAKPETASHVCFLLQDAYRKLGNIELDTAVGSDETEKRKSAAERAVQYYLGSLEQSKLGEKYSGPGSRQTSRFLTAQVGRIFCQANLAEAYELLLKAPATSTSERLDYDKKCRALLDDRIATCAEVIKLQTSNRYFWALLAEGYRNRGHYYQEYSPDKNKIENKEKAFEDMRLAYLVAFPAVDPRLEVDYEKATEVFFGPQAKKEVAKLNEGAMKQIGPLLRKEPNGADANPAADTNN